jgi:uncharacterized protein (DUF2237 family)
MHRRIRDTLLPVTGCCAGATGSRALFSSSGPRDDDKEKVGATTTDENTSAFQLNMDGQPLKRCSGGDPVTGFYRDGFCHTGASDRGNHLACIEATDEFLDYSKSSGNDLSTPRPPGFPGLVAGDRWCVCAARWMQAAQAGQAPPLVREASHELMAHFLAKAKAA